MPVALVVLLLLFVVLHPDTRRRQALRAAERRVLEAVRRGGAWAGPLATEAIEALIDRGILVRTRAGLAIDGEALRRERWRAIAFWAGILALPFVMVGVEDGFAH